MDQLVTPEQVERIRPIRLYHWRRVLRERQFENLSPEGSRLRRLHKLSADVHMKFVQSLNDFFPVEDTAEQDNKAQATK